MDDFEERYLLMQTQQILSRQSEGGNNHNIEIFKIPEGLSRALHVQFMKALTEIPKTFDEDQ